MITTALKSEIISSEKEVKTFKSPFIPTARKFNLKMLFVGNSGSGKTDLAATYTKGPIHFYILDKGGEKTLEKNRANRKPTDPMLSVDLLSSNDFKFSHFWDKFKSDEDNGFFNSLADQNGILVIDSLTSLNAKALKEVSGLNHVNPLSIGKVLDMKKAMGKPFWGQLLSWMIALISNLQELPCAVIVIAHLHILMNSDQEVVARYPYVNGQFRQHIGIDFDETYLLETRGSKYITHFKESNKFEAKSRVFSMKSVEDLNLNDLTTAYLTGKDTF